MAWDWDDATQIATPGEHAYIRASERVAITGLAPCMGLVLARAGHGDAYAAHMASGHELNAVVHAAHLAFGTLEGLEAFLAGASPQHLPTLKDTDEQRRAVFHDRMRVIHKLHEIGIGRPRIAWAPEGTVSDLGYDTAAGKAYLRTETASGSVLVDGAFPNRRLRPERPSRR